MIRSFATPGSWTARAPVVLGFPRCAGRLRRRRAPRTTKPLSRHTIVLEGGILCPGFVDGHSHSERPLLSGEPTDCKTMQGVATEKLGLDGMSPPLCDLSPYSGRYARELGVLSQEEAIRKMTSLTGPQDPAGAQGRHPARI
ncbi:MAG: hypothetical protein ACLSAH_21260 [Bilophila wadsworthia]